MDTTISSKSTWRGERGELWLLGAAMLVFGLIALTLEISAEEDAFIYYRYAWNWAHGRGLVFNPGDPVEGFSGPIWMAVLALAARAGLDLPRTAPVLGILCGAATLIATWFLARTAGLSRSGRLAAVAGLALSYPFIVWSRSGLETPFYSLAIVIAAGAYLAAEYPLREGPGTRRWVAAVALVLVSLGRPEGLLLTALVIADRLTDRWDVLGALRYAGPTAIGYGSYLLWRLHTFKSLAPNTSVKLYPLLVDRSASQLLGYILFLGVLPLALPLLALLDLRDRPRQERRRLGFLFLAVCLLSFFFNFAAGGDYRPGFRYLVPTLPLLLVAVWYAAERLGAGGGRAAFLTSPWARACLFALLLAGSVFLLRQNPPRIHGWRERVFQSWRDPYSETWHWGIQIAGWIDAHVPQNGIVAFGQMGRVPYYLARKGHEVTFIDTLGLVDRPIARVYRFDRKLADLLQDVRGGMPLAQALEKGRRERANRVAESILARRPDFILIETALDDYQMMRALRENPGFQAAYREIDALPHGGPPYVRIYARVTASSSARRRSSSHPL